MEPKFYTALEAAELLGVSDKTVRNRIRRGEIPATKTRLPTGQESWQISSQWLAEQVPDHPTEPTEQPPDARRNPPDSSGKPPSGEFDSTRRSADGTPAETPSDSSGIAAEGGGTTGGSEQVVVYRESAETREQIERLGQRVATLEGMAAQKMLAAIEQIQSETQALREQLDASGEKQKAAIKDAVSPLITRISESERKREEAEERSRALEAELAAEKAKGWWQKLRGK